MCWSGGIALHGFPCGGTNRTNLRVHCALLASTRSFSKSIAWPGRSKLVGECAPETSLPGIPSSIPGKRHGSMRCSMVGDLQKENIHWRIFSNKCCHCKGSHFSNMPCLHFWRLARGGHAGICSWWRLFTGMWSPEHHVTWHGHILTNLLTCIHVAFVLTWRDQQNWHVKRYAIFGPIYLVSVYFCTSKWETKQTV